MILFQQFKSLHLIVSARYRKVISELWYYKALCVPLSLRELKGCEIFHNFFFMCFWHICCFVASITITIMLSFSPKDIFIVFKVSFCWLKKKQNPKKSHQQQIDTQLPAARDPCRSFLCFQGLTWVRRASRISHCSPHWRMAFLKEFSTTFFFVWQACPEGIIQYQKGGWLQQFLANFIMSVSHTEGCPCSKDNSSYIVR